MRKTSVFSVFAITLLALVSPAIAQEDQYNAYMYVVRGPVRANAAEFGGWSTDTIWELYSTRTLSNRDIGYRLTADVVTQRTSELTDHTLWFVVRITSKDPTTKFSLDMVRFEESSSDPGNTLRNLYFPALTKDLVYSHRAIGVIWAPGGPRVSDTILYDMQEGTNLVNELCFVGMQSPYFQYPLATVENYVYGFTNNFLVAGKCEIVDTSSGMILATARRTVQTIGSPIPPRLSVTYLGGPLVRVGFNMEPGRTATLVSTPQLYHPSWTVEATVNSGDVVIRRNAGVTKFFNIVLQ